MIEEKDSTYQVCEAIATVFDYIGKPGIFHTEVNGEYFMMVRGKSTSDVLKSFGVGIIPPDGGEK